jgi:hypothetical protein
MQVAIALFLLGMGVLIVAIALFLLGMGVLIVVGGYRVFRRMMAQAAEVSDAEEELSLDEIETTGEVTADGLVYLFGHEFVREKAVRPMTLSRDKAFAPLTEAELDPEDWALQLLYVSLCELHAQSCVEFRVVERDSTFLPPFPQKRWEIEMIQRTPFPSATLADSLDVAFDLMRKRKETRVAQGKEEPGELWCALDEIVERALKAMRQEISFWERSGVYGDLRNYVASALIAQGYLIAPPRQAWFERGSARLPKPNEPAIEKLHAAAETLKRRLDQFRLKHGSPYARGELEPPEGQQAVHNVDPELATREGDFDDMPLDDCLRISIYETLLSLKQLEPSGDAGI